MKKKTLRSERWKFFVRESGLSKSAACLFIGLKPSLAIKATSHFEFWDNSLMVNSNGEASNFASLAIPKLCRTGKLDQWDRIVKLVASPYQSFAT